MSTLIRKEYIMDFDERLIKRKHVLKAIQIYRKEKRKPSRPARSAFLIDRGKRLPAKFILRLAFEVATGTWVASEQLTGGRASVRVLKNLGFNAIYDKPTSTCNRNKVKNARREAFRLILQRRWGKVLTEFKFDAIQVPPLTRDSLMPPVFRKILRAVEGHRNMRIEGRPALKPKFDFYIPQINVAIEFDERQHFTPSRAVALRSYPANIKLGFDRKRWIALSEEIRAGDNSPRYRDEQRSFYDAVRDILASKAGLKPVVRVYENDVAWEKEGASSPKAKEILKQIARIAGITHKKGH